MKADLHCHSHYSDGKHSPAFLLQRAADNEISHLAITDHDCIQACVEVAGDGGDITIINGVEISCDWEGREIHVLGLAIALDSPPLLALLAKQQQRRRSRMQEIDRKLQALGTPGLWDYLESLPCLAYTRSHAADFLVERGLSKTRAKAFKTYLGKRGRIYAAPDWCSLVEAVEAIQAAQGVAIIAHPGRYPLSKRKLESLVDSFQSAGGDGLEISYANIDPHDSRYLFSLAATRNLYCSAGSDFHDAAASWTDLGKFPVLDAEAKKSAIWLHPRWHS